MTANAVGTPDPARRLNNYRPSCLRRRLTACDIGDNVTDRVNLARCRQRNGSWTVESLPNLNRIDMTDCSQYVNRPFGYESVQKSPITVTFAVIADTAYSNA